MKSLQKIVIGIALITMTASCSVFKNTSVPEMKTDPVCGMQVAKSEAYHYKYEGKTYYFDKYNCKETFKMTPKKYSK